MLTLETYSERGMVLRGDSALARKLVADTAPKAMMQEQRGGLVMSRKYEARIREALARMGMVPCESKQPIPTLEPVRQPAMPKAKKKRATCNCNAASERYDKVFPHAPGSIVGCHMDKATGAALDGIIRCQPNRMCRACLETDSNLAWMFDRGMENPLPDQCFGNKGA